MSDYQVIAKKFRPKKFSEVFEQQTVVQTLKNAIRMNRLGHAYLFCGTRGTGKTTLARLFAKAINCDALSAEGEPCNSCRSCTEITSGSSLDMIEIDGASNRGIDDIRSLNETVGYASSHGKHKIYLIDEVHMLTKEAFNALLKTLEEPPSHVIFFFATTEPHKVLPTILSRCQRFDLKRITPEQIEKKLASIAEQLEIPVEAGALRLIAHHAEGSLRDAESLLDQLLCFEEPPITAELATKALGLIPTDFFFRLDKAAEKGDLAAGFSLADTLFKEGAHLQYVLESLASHFQMIAKVHMGETPPLPAYNNSAHIYSKHHVLDILNYLLDQIEKSHRTPFKKIHLEVVFLHIIRSMKKIPLESLVERLENLKTGAPSQETKVPPPKIEEPPPPAETPKVEEIAPPPLEQAPPPAPAAAQIPKVEEVAPPQPPTAVQSPPPPELPKVEEIAPLPLEQAPHPAPAAVQPPPPTIQEKIKHEQVMRFASVELNGALKK
ncbi:MAG: DNA polymerase III subunit gamma/tau [Chlamydiia bacterium]|nr:DNA polymerase III subunit gamma/tau [Chlamydiia bacterium]MCB1115242.1 DNA polymerase III subunit gamma/tau [Chlamydiia bacterium]